MKRNEEIELIKEVLAIREQKSAFLDSAMSTKPTQHYTDTARFDKERDQLFRVMPQPLAHVSELAKPNDFVRRELAGLPILITRDSEGVVHAFLNVCRHRGTRLVDESAGCKRRFSCPYHAWTWDNRGALVAIPHQKLGFPDIDSETMGLRRMGAVERHGWIWVCAQGDQAPDIDAYLGELGDDFGWIDTANHSLVQSEERDWAANWKILVEGGIEAYHFRVAHRNTIGPFFHDNLSTYRSFGDNMRSVLVRKSIDDLNTVAEEQWRIREHAQLLYSLFPSTALLVQSDHIAWISMQPVSVKKTRLRLSTLVPKERLQSEADHQHWRKNHEITVNTLNEDFIIAESIQSGLDTGANDVLTFGRFEGALKTFNDKIDSLLVQD